MLDFNNLNYLAIALAWFVNVSIGAYWYSPAGFGKLWTKLTGVDMMKLPQNEANRAITYVSVSAAVQAFTLAIVLNTIGVDTLLEGISAGLLLWLGLTAATTIGTNFYSQKGWKFWWLNASYFLVVMTLNSIILSIWH